MKNVQMKVEEMVKGIDSKNFEYIVSAPRFESHMESLLRWEAKGDEEMVNFKIEDIEKFAREFDGLNLTPANVKVGDGATMQLWSDAHAGTIVKVTKASITIQRDHAELDPNFKPEIVAGGFAGHCTNQSEQTYTYSPNPNGELVTFRWSKKFGRYQNPTYKAYKGRNEFYDYNF